MPQFGWKGFRLNIIHHLKWKGYCLIKQHRLLYFSYITVLPAHNHHPSSWRSSKWKFWEIPKRKIWIIPWLLSTTRLDLRICWTTACSLQNSFIVQSNKCVSGCRVKGEKSIIQSKIGHFQRRWGTCQNDLIINKLTNLSGVFRVQQILSVDSYILPAPKRGHFTSVLF